MIGAAAPRAMIALILIGFVSFVGILFLLGTGASDNPQGRAGNHAASGGLNGFRALRRVTDAADYDSRLSRNREDLSSPGLAILTPPLQTDPEMLNEIIERRRISGPTIVILPKWVVIPAGDEPGWVNPMMVADPRWLADVPALGRLELSTNDGPQTGWRGLGVSGALPASDKAAVTMQGAYLPLVTDGNGTMLAGVLDDGTAAWDLLDAIGAPQSSYGKEMGRWPLIVVSEPDLLNNWGFAQPESARLATALIGQASRETGTQDAVFDLTLNGLGAEQNLLSLAFQPPFLAATLCLLLAALVLGWRAFARFGPAITEERAMAFGKRQLVANSAALVERSKRSHLLAAPYIARVRRILAGRLGAAAGPPDAQGEAIDQRLLRRGHGENAFTGPAADLRNASTHTEIIRAARALKALERTLT